MAKTVTAYKTVYDLSEFDLANINVLEEHTGADKNTAVLQAIFFCQLSLQFRQEGKCTSVLYKQSGSRQTSARIDHGKVAEAYNNRSKDANRIRFTSYRSTEALQAINDIKGAIKASSDSVAVAYALEYAATCVRKLQAANDGKSAQLFFSYNNDPGRGGQLLKKHPYNLSRGNSFRKARQSVGSSLGKLNPFRRKPKVLHGVEHLGPPDAAAESAAKEKAAQEEAARKVAAAAQAAEDAAKQVVESEIVMIQNGISEPVSTKKPMTFKKKDGGFSL